MAGPGKAIEARPAIVFRSPPLRRDRAFLLQPKQKGIQRPLIYREQVSANLLDAPRDAVAMQRTKDIERLQYHQRQRALQNIGLFAHKTFLWLSNRTMPHFLLESNR